MDRFLALAARAAQRSALGSISSSAFRHAPHHLREASDRPLRALEESLLIGTRRSKAIAQYTAGLPKSSYLCIAYIPGIRCIRDITSAMISFRSRAIFRPVPESKPKK